MSDLTEEQRGHILGEAINELVAANCDLVYHRVCYPTTAHPLASERIELARANLVAALSRLSTPSISRGGDHD